MSAYYEASHDTTKEAARSPQAQPSYHGVHHGGIEVVPDPPPGWKQQPQYGPAGYPQYVGAGEEPRIMGMRRTTFLLTVALLIVIIAAAVGGGIGGSMAV